MKAVTLSLVLAVCGPAFAQKIPPVACHVEDYPVQSVSAWQFPTQLNKVQVVVVRDPAGEQEARFDLTHGASLISLRYKGKEVLFGESASAALLMFSPRLGSEEDLKGLPTFWSSFVPDQGDSSMGIYPTTTGVACETENAFRAFTMLEDRGVDGSFQAHPLLGVWAGKISTNYPPGYATAYSLETNASWTPNPGAGPKYFLKLDSSVINTRGGDSGPLQWYMTVTGPWDYEHLASYPEKCTKKTPCTSAESNATAIGRYRDEQMAEGVAVVVPNGMWRSDSVYAQDNAEFLAMYGGDSASWNPPRRTVGIAIQHALRGIQPNRFSWYICAGSWQGAKQFAESQPAPDKTVLPTPPPVPAGKPEAKAIAAACQTTEFQPEPGQVDQAIVLEDPAGEQKVIFDTTEGGAIVSWKYHDVEHTWGYNGGGMMQMAFHTDTKLVPWPEDYNPTQAGDGTAMSPVTGIACDGTRSVDLLVTLLDFNHNYAFFNHPLLAVWDGRINTFMPLSYSSPYTLEERASWVENPGGSPKYYLKMNEHYVHLADEKVGPIAYDFASYNPWEFPTRAISPENCPCDSNKLNYLVGGWYQDDRRLEGFAVAMPSSNFPNNKFHGDFNTDYMWRNHNFHLGSMESLDGIQAKDFVWYGMPGSWDSALKFAKTLR
jgi:hypothetical protein